MHSLRSLVCNIIKDFSQLWFPDVFQDVLQLMSVTYKQQHWKWRPQSHCMIGRGMLLKSTPQHRTCARVTSTHSYDALNATLNCVI